jgi:hypothetical protein
VAADVALPPLARVADRGRPTTGRLAVATGLLGVGWVAVAGVLYHPEGSSLPVACPFHALTGLDCPGCGSTRALGALVRLDPAAAFDHNVLAPVALVVLAVAWVRWMRAAWGGRPTRDVIRGPAAVVAVGVAVVAFAVVRNLEAASWLASGLASSGP